MARQLSRNRSATKEDSPLSRTGTSLGISEDMIKSASQRFSCDIVFKLNLISMKISRMCGLDSCVNLVELNLSSNNITRIEGLECLIELKCLILANNQIAQIEGIWALQKLEQLHLQGNQISNLASLKLQQLKELPCLRAVYLQNIDRSCQNLVCRLPGYKAAMLAALPQLKNLDGERWPATAGYAEVAEQVEQLTAHPPEPKPLELPEVAPWLLPGSADLLTSSEAAGSCNTPAGSNSTAVGSCTGAEQELQGKHGKLVKAVDECHMLQHVLREELVKAQAGFVS